MKIFLSVLFFFVGLIAWNQNLNLTQQKTIGGVSDDSQRLFPAPNGNGFYLIGISDSDISGDKTENSRGFLDLWIVRLDNNFNLIWDKTIGGDQDERFAGAVFEDDKIYLSSWSKSGISGEKTMASFGLNDCWIICLDTNANLLWQFQYGGSLDEGYSKLVDFSDSSLLMVSQSRSPVSGNKTFPTMDGMDDLWLVELSKLDGHIIQQKSIGSLGNNSFPSVVKSSFNNHIYIVSSTETGISGDKTDPGFGLIDSWIVELDENLNILQDKSFGGNLNENFSFIKQHGPFLYLTSASNSGISGNKTTSHYGLDTKADAWVVKLDHDLQIIWDKNFGGTNNETAGIVQAMNNGNLVFSCMSESGTDGNKTSPQFGTDYDTWFLLLSENGEIIRQETFGGDLSDGHNFQEGILLPNPNFPEELILCAASSSAISGNKTVGTNGASDTWLGKIDVSYYLYLNLEPTAETSNLIHIYPNPFSTEVHFLLEELTEDVSLQILSLDGKVVFEQLIPQGTTEVKWESDQTNQILLYQISGPTVFQTGKMVSW